MDKSSNPTIYKYIYPVNFEGKTGNYCCLNLNTKNLDSSISFKIKDDLIEYFGNQNHGERKYCVNLEKVTGFVDSSGYSALMTFLNYAKRYTNQKQDKLILINPSELIQREIILSDLNPYFEIFSSTDEL